jgi:hypothetical protein
MSSDYAPLPVQDIKNTNQEKISLTNFIRIYDQIIPNELCDEMIHLLNSSEKRRIDEGYLRRDEVSLNPHVHAEIFGKVSTCIKSVYHRYKQDIGWVSGSLFQCNSMEYPVIVSYKPSQDKKELFHDHADAWHNDSATRQISIIMYLSDVEEGGSTTFTNYDISVKPVKGRVLLFPANFIYKHRAEPPISDIKYASISWMHFDGPTRYITIKI